MDGDVVGVDGEVSLVLGSNEIGSEVVLPGVMGNSYLVLLGRLKLKVGKETVTTLLAAFWPQLLCWMCSAQERMLTGSPGT